MDMARCQRMGIAKPAGRAQVPSETPAYDANAPVPGSAQALAAVTYNTNNTLPAKREPRFGTRAYWKSSEPYGEGWRRRQQRRQIDPENRSPNGTPGGRDMIIETRGDVVYLSGSLHKNQWMSIRAAANLLLHDHPQGIIVDCAGLENISEDGARTFLEAMRDIESARARILVASLPQKVLTVIKTVPGVRSQLPIAASVEAARASLKVQRRAPTPRLQPMPRAAGR